MTEAQLANIRLVADAMTFNGLPNLGDDAMAYAGSATWDDWRNHVPQVLVAHWEWLSQEARLCVYLTARVVTAYNPQGVSAERQAVERAEGNL